MKCNCGIKEICDCKENIFTPNLDNDFGFSSYDKEELKSINVDENVTEKIYNVLMNLLNQLEKDADKEYIHWPNRKDKIKNIKEQINKIYQPVR